MADRVGVVWLNPGVNAVILWLITVPAVVEERHDHVSVRTLVVSILVLVDVSLEGHARVGMEINIKMFQSLFSWMFRSK